MATIERVKTKLGKKTIIKTPIRYAYFQPAYTRVEGTGKKKVDKFIPDNGRELVPLLVDLKTGKAVEDEGLLNLTESDANPCPFATNSKENPVVLEYGNRMRYFEAIEYISILEYKDTGNTVFTFLKRKTCWLRSKERVFHKNKIMYKLNIRKGGKTTITKNGMPCLTNASINSVFMDIMPLMRVKYIARYRGRVILKKMFTKHFLGLDKMSAADFDRLSYSELTALYRVKQNPKLYDLPWQEAELASIYRSSISLSEFESVHVNEGERSVANIKVSLNRYLRRGDTKQAIEACFFGFVYPKSIRRVLMKTEPLEFTFKNYKAIAEVIETHGVDNARNLITNNDGSPNKGMIGNPHYIELLAIGFSLNQIRRYGRGFMRDTLTMRERLIDNGHTLDFMPNMREYHDYLMRLVIELDRERNELREIENIERRREWEKRNAGLIQRRKRLDIGYSTIDTSEQIPRFEADGFIFRSPVLASELTKVGNDLNICVGMYKEDFFLGRLDIVLVTKLNEAGGEKYVACLEIKRQQLVQAKLNSNRSVYSNRPLMKTVSSWAIKNGINLACEDVGVRFSEYVEFNPDNQERVDFLKEPEPEPEIKLIDVN